MTKPIKITKRQKQIFVMLEKGLTNKQMAAELKICEHTVKVHLWRLFQRIGVHSRGQALSWYHANCPASALFALRAAFDAACRMADYYKSHGQTENIREFESHREAVERLEGEPA